MTSFIIETNKTDWVITIKRKEKNKSKVNLFMNSITVEYDEHIAYYNEEFKQVLNFDFDDIYTTIINNLKKINIIPINELEIKNNIMNILERY